MYKGLKPLFAPDGKINHHHHNILIIKQKKNWFNNKIFSFKVFMGLFFNNREAGRFDIFINSVLSEIMKSKY